MMKMNMCAAHERRLPSTFQYMDLCQKERYQLYALDKQETPGMRHSFEWYFRGQFSVTKGQELDHLEHVSDMTVTGHFMWRIIWSQRPASGKHLMTRKNGFLKPILLAQWIEFGQCLSSSAFVSSTFELSCNQSFIYHTPIPSHMRRPNSIMYHSDTYTSVNTFYFFYLSMTCIHIQLYTTPVLF